jgi:hypothetical protein
MLLGSKYATHSDRLERWLGADNVNHLSQLMKGWYGPPIAIRGVPGAVYATGDGDFIGNIRAGWEASSFDRAFDILKRLKRAARIVTSPRRAILHAGFASLSDLISEATGGKRYEWQFNKVGPANGIAKAANALWAIGPTPAAGGVSSVAPGGRVPTSATAGAFPFTNPPSGDTMHFISGAAIATLSNTLLIYDRIFDVIKTPNSSATEAVTGVPTRYQSSTPGTDDYAAGNFLFIEVTNALSNTIHNHTVVLYRNQAGTDNQTMPVLAGQLLGSLNSLDHPISQWFAPLATGDTGIMDLAQMQLSASLTNSGLDYVIGHPIAWMPCPVANIVCCIDSLSSSFNLARIFNDAALSLLEVNKPVTTARTSIGTFTSIAG